MRESQSERKRGGIGGNRETKKRDNQRNEKKKRHPRKCMDMMHDMKQMAATTLAQRPTNAGVVVA